MRSSTIATPDFLRPCLAATLRLSGGRVDATSALRVLIVISLAALSLPNSAKAADSHKSQFFGELRARRLFGVAENYAAFELNKPRLEQSERVALTIELSRTYAEHAWWTSGQEQEELWDAAAQVVLQLAEELPEHPLRLLLDAQGLFVKSARANALRFAAALPGIDRQLNEQAVAAAGEVIPQLEDLSDRINARRKQLRRSSAESEHPTGYELRSWERRVTMELARMNLNLAHLLKPETKTGDPAGSDPFPQQLPGLNSSEVQREEALAAAAELLDEVASGWEGDPVTWESRVARIELSRLRDDPQQAAARARSLLKQELPIEFRRRAVAEHVRALLEMDDIAEALAALVEHGAEYPPLTNELIALQIEALLEAWKVAVEKQNRELADQLLEQAGGYLPYAGGYWRSYAESQLRRADETVRYGPQVADLVQSARTAYQRGESRQAAEAYTLAATEAAENGHRAQAEAFAFTAASVLLKGGHYESAAASLREFVVKHPESDKAAEADLLAAWALGQLYSEQPTQQRREAYLAALQQHREQFPNSDTAGEAAWMIGLFQQSRQQWTRALAAYSEVPPGHAKAPAAHSRIAAVYQQILERLRELGRPVTAWRTRAISQLKGFADVFPPNEQSLSEEQATVALALAKLYLSGKSPDYPQADRLLDRVIRSAAGQPAGSAWPVMLEESRQLRILSLAGQQRTDDARQLLEQLTRKDPDVLLQILTGLSTVAAETSISGRMALGEIQLAAAERVAAQRESLDQATVRQLDEALAEAYIATGQVGRAIDVYDALVRAYPNDDAMLETAARLLDECPRLACKQRAYEYWKRLERLRRDGSPGWLTARYHIAATGADIGRIDESRKLIAVTRLLYPALGGPALAAKFSELENRLGTPM